MKANKTEITKFMTPIHLGQYTFLDRINTSGVRNRLLLKNRECEKLLWHV